MNSSSTYILSQLTIWCVLIVGAIAAIVLGVQISEGRVIEVFSVMFLVFAVVMGVLLGKRYWLVLPFGCTVSGLPTIPLGAKSFELGEMVVAGCFAIFIGRLCFRQQRLDILNVWTLPVAAYVFWVFYVFMNNPVGLMAFGSTTGGARFYFKILLAFMAYLVMSNQRIDLKDLKWVLVGLITGAACSTVWGFVAYFLFKQEVPTGLFEEEGFYTWHQSMAHVPFWSFLIIFSHYRFNQILSLQRMYWVPYLIICLAVAFDSGKRAAVGVILAIPVLASMFRREWLYTYLMGISGSLLIAFLVIGQGSMFELPQRVQRTLMNFPGQWDREVMVQIGSGEDADAFRTEMRRRAMERIKENPWVGKGWGLNMDEAMREVNSQQDVTIALLALGSSWHNTWLGIAADFGIPGSVLFAIFMITALFYGYRVFRMTAHGTLPRTVGMALFLYTMTVLIRSWTSGHAANTPFDLFWKFGLIISIYMALKEGLLEGANKVKQDAKNQDPVKNLEELSVKEVM